MTNEEKFRAGKVLYKNDEGNYVLELWGASTKHPDSVFHMEDFEMAWWVDRNNPEDVETQVLPWILECASKLFIPSHSYQLAKWAIDRFEKERGING